MARRCDKLGAMRIYRMFMRTVVLTSLAWVGLAWSSTFNPMPLSRLVKRSAAVVVATPVSRSTHWATLGTASRLVTDYTLEVSWSLRGKTVAGEDIVVRTLGGIENGLVTLVHGEARLALGQTSLLFLAPDGKGIMHVLGMAQGHYPTEPDENGEWRVKQSPGLDGVLRQDLSAVHELAGKRLLDVPGLLQSAEVAP